MRTLSDSEILHAADMDVLFEQFYSEHLYDVGGETMFPRTTGYANSNAMVSGSLRLCGFKCKRTEVAGRASFNSGATAATATPSLVRYGLYHREIDGATYTLVASTPNDVNIFAAINTRYTKAFSAPYTKIRGEEYGLAFLIVSPSAMPTMQVAFNGTQPGSPHPFLVAPMRSGTLTAQADLPASINTSALVASGLLPICELTP